MGKSSILFILFGFDKIKFFLVQFSEELFSSVETSREAWERLNSSYTSSSRSRIISLKSKLTKNPKGTRSVAEFLHEMKSIADELALAQSPILEEDLVVHILSQLGDEFNNIVAAIKVRESVISFSELFEKLVDFERMLKDSDSSQSTILTTANVTQKSSFKFQPHNKQYSGNQGRPNKNYSNSRKFRDHTYRPQWQNQGMIHAIVGNLLVF
ncbi:zinc finger, CCHC-type [Artemisia annua]|uniref:Zinc finger, CCHC-type n=1 Tax=Artemisia annua TaxID=35608 RepID=A0A2U1PJY5_ARTAN|nr:zinc finger, CCHC-type [Artemisia annua]